MPLRKLSLSLIGKAAARITLIEYCAFFTAFIFYCASSYIPDRHPFTSSLDPSRITHAEFTCKNNPEKRGDVYIMPVECRMVSIQKNDSIITNTCSGITVIYIPSDILESLYPGKLYSNTTNTAIFEKGARLYCSVSCFFTRENTLVFKIKDAEQLGWASSSAYYRALLRIQFKRLMYAWNDAGALLLALLSGSREYLAENVSEGFKNAGLSHILALSGMHLSFFAGISEKASKKISGKRGSRIFSFSAVVLFVWFAGFSPSLLRAFLCTAILLFCSLFYVKPKITSILSVCFLCQICISPHDGTCISFLLSYSALFGIASIGDTAHRFLVRYLPPVVSKALSASIGAQLCTIPFTIAFFGTITPIGILASVVISPLISIFMVLGLFCILLSLSIPSLLLPLSSVIGGLYEIIHFLVLCFSQIPQIHV